MPLPVHLTKDIVVALQARNALHGGSYFHYLHVLYLECYSLSKCSLYHSLILCHVTTTQYSVTHSLLMQQWSVSNTHQTAPASYLYEIVSWQIFCQA